MRGPTKFLALTVGVAACSVVVTALHAPTPVLATVALALLASLGYVWVTVILRGRAPALELVCVAVGLVLAAPVLGGIVLQEAGIALSRTAWLSLFVGLTLIGDVALAVRYRRNAREHEPEDSRPMRGQGWLGITRPDLRSAKGLAPAQTPPEPAPTQMPPWDLPPAETPRTERVPEISPQPTDGTKSRPRISPLNAVACGLAVLIAGGAIWVAQAGAASEQYPGFTELWLSSKDHSASVDNLGVSNQEGKTEKYRLELLRNGHVSKTWNLTLPTGHTWQRTVAVNLATRANLYLLPDMSQPYRYVDTGLNEPVKSVKTHRRKK